MTFQETSIGEGIFAADENNEANSERGAHVLNGGKVTVGASSQDIALNIDACDIRIQGTNWFIASGTPAVTLADNSTAYPRRDLVFASKGPTPSDPGSFEVLTGTPIDPDTFQTLVNEGVINQDGTPIAKPEDIPEIQPPAFKGHRDDATLLAMVYVPSGASDSTAMAADYITDLRMEGIGVNDVLRQGEAIANIESMNDDLNASVTEFFGETHWQWKSRTVALDVSTQNVMNTGDTESTFFHIPQGFDLPLWRVTLAVKRDYLPTGIKLEVRAVDDAQGNTTLLKTYDTQTTKASGGTAVTVFAGNDRVLEFRLHNDSNTTEQITASVQGHLTPR